MITFAAHCGKPLRRLVSATSSSQKRWMAVVNLSDESKVEQFSSQNSKSVLYFTATRCPPCKAIKPVYEKMSEKHPTVAFGKVDVDENSDSAANFEISAVPTFIVFDGKTPIEKFSGADAGLLEKHVVDLEGR